MADGYVDVPGARLWYERAGEGFPVVLVHPEFWDARIWDQQFERFSQFHDTIRYDLRGYGRSDPPMGPYSELGDLWALLHALKVDRCALVGCGNGARLAIDAALARPETVEAIVPVAPVLSGYSWQDPGLQELVREVDSAVREGDLRRAMDIELAVWAPLSAADPATPAREIAMDNTSALLLDDVLLEEPPPALPHLREVRAATLVVVGDEDLREIHAIADLIAECIPGAQKRVVAEADLLVNVRKPEKFNRLVLDFLSFRF
ncbi:MAG TPA: alpha/beta fold hydrolase [Actinomycetota bacterium]|nr:alpha/beta fold hydrolase [Actinomycetota bacterium]